MMKVSQESTMAWKVSVNKCLVLDVRLQKCISHSTRTISTKMGLKYFTLSICLSFCLSIYLPIYLYVRDCAYVTAHM